MELKNVDQNFGIYPLLGIGRDILPGLAMRNTDSLTFQVIAMTPGRQFGSPVVRHRTQQLQNRSGHASATISIHQTFYSTNIFIL